MYTLALISVVVVATLANNIVKEDDQLWEEFKAKFGKKYDDESEHKARKAVFLESLKLVQEHNAKYERGEVSFSFGINEFSDLYNHERQKKLLCLVKPIAFPSKGVLFKSSKNVSLPDSIDWTKKGAVTDVKQQGGCGSCWAFAATGALEAQNFFKSKKLVSLSEQNLVDCGKSQGNLGCGGGEMAWAFKYVSENEGIDTEASYPYEGKDGMCRFNQNTIGCTASGYVKIPVGDEDNLKETVATKGPVSVAINIIPDDFIYYKQDVYVNDNCSPTNLNFAALVVGYGTDKKGGDYWIVKNSFGKSWGMDGYIWMARNRNNMCGIASQAVYPLV